MSIRPIQALGCGLAIAAGIAGASLMFLSEPSPRRTTASPFTPPAVVGSGVLESAVATLPYATTIPVHTPTSSNDPSDEHIEHTRIVGSSPRGIEELLASASAPLTERSNTTLTSEMSSVAQVTSNAPALAIPDCLREDSKVGWKFLFDGDKTSIPYEQWPPMIKISHDPNGKRGKDARFIDDDRFALGYFHLILSDLETSGRKDLLEEFVDLFYARVMPKGETHQSLFSEGNVLTRAYDELVDWVGHDHDVVARYRDKAVSFIAQGDEENELSFTSPYGQFLKNTVDNTVETPALARWLLTAPQDSDYHGLLDRMITEEVLYWQERPKRAGVRWQEELDRREALARRFEAEKGYHEAAYYREYVREWINGRDIFFERDASDNPRGLETALQYQSRLRELQEAQQRGD